MYWQIKTPASFSYSTSSDTRPFPLGFIPSPLPLLGLAKYAFERKAETWGLESHVRSWPCLPTWSLFQQCDATPCVALHLLASAGSERCESPSPGVVGEVMQERVCSRALRLCRPPRAPNSWVGRTAYVCAPFQELAGGGVG